MKAYLIQIEVRLSSKSYFQTLGESRQNCSSAETASSRALRELRHELKGRRIAEYKIHITKC